MSRPGLRLFFAFALFLTVSGVAFRPLPAQAQQQTRRLILKDGSYQAVTQYEIQGDRVHFLSAERYDWEDIPASLVDWEATKKYDADLAAGKVRVHLEETPEEKEEREKEEANSPEIAPRLRLPGTGGVFLFESFQGQPELAEILQNGSELSKHTSKSALRAAINPIASSKQAFELKGQHAQIQSHSTMPSIYVDIDTGPNDIPVTDRFRLVRADIKKDTRVVGSLKITFTGKTSEEGSFLPTNVEKVGMGEWVKVTPAKPLPPGEYALVEILGPQEMNLYVWDFGVNANAPANPNVWRPVPAKTAESH